MRTLEVKRKIGRREKHNPKPPVWLTQEMFLQEGFSVLLFKLKSGKADRLLTGEHESITKA